MSTSKPPVCSNCGKDLAVGDKFHHRAPQGAFALFFFLQSRGQKPQVKSRTGRLDVCNPCVAAFRTGRKPRPGFGPEFVRALMAAVLG